MTVCAIAEIANDQDNGERGPEPAPVGDEYA
jgi:hypothetical protein